MLKVDYFQKNNEIVWNNRENAQTIVILLLHMTNMSYWRYLHTYVL